MHTARYGNAAAVLDGKIYSIGGELTNGSVEVYDPSEDRWRDDLVADMNTPRHTPGAATLNGIPYAIGGWHNVGGSHRLKTVERYVNNGWEFVAEMNTERSAFGTAVVDGEIYVMGGTNQNGAPLNSVEKYTSIAGTSMFVIAGKVTNYDGTDAETGLKVNVSNETRSLAINTTVGKEKPGDYRVTFANTENEVVADVNDMLNVKIKDAGDNLIATANHTITQADIDAARAIINVRIPATGIQIFPEGPLEMNVGNTKQFSVTVEDYRGTHPNVTDVTWEVIGGIGTISTSGLFTATIKDTESVKTGSVKAMLDGLEDSVTINVKEGPAVVNIETPTGGEKIRGGTVYNITWNATGEGLDHIHLLYSTDGGANYQDIVPNTANDGDYEWTTPEINSSTVRVKAIAEDESNNALAEDTSDANFTIDSTAPSTPVVTGDGDCVTDGSQLYASWTSFDLESNISEYQYAIGTTSGGSNVVIWTSVGTDTEVTKTGLSLTLGQTYYFSVKAQNGVGIWSTVGNSDGITYQLPKIGITPTSLTFNAFPGGTNPDAKTLNITNEGCGTFTWNASGDAAWLSPSLTAPTGGDCAKDETDEVAVTVDITGLGVGTYNATITISATDASNTPQSIPVTLNIVSEGISSVSVSPTDVPVGVGKEITVTVIGEANAQSVTFSIADVPNATDVPMTESTSGDYTGSYIVRNGDVATDAKVTAKMTNSLGNLYSKESPDKVTLDGVKPEVKTPAEPPTGTIPDGDKATLLTVSVTDTVSGVESVKINLSPVNGQPQQQMYDDGTNGDEIANDGIYSLMITVVGTGEGKYDLDVTATDLAGNINSDEFLSLYVDDTPPIVTEPKADPNFVPSKHTSLLTVNVTDEPFGALGLTVTIDLSAIEGSENQTMYDDGTHGDKVANDNVYSYETSVVCGEDDIHLLPITITDIAGHQETANIKLTVDCYLMAVITYPPEHACMRTEVCVTGTVRGGPEGLLSWTLQKSFEDGPFTDIAFGTSHILDGELKCWNTIKETDGDYTLKLKVVGEQGNEAVDMVTVEVDNSPPHPSISIADECAEGHYTRSGASICVSGQTESKSVLISATLMRSDLPMDIKEVTSDISIDEDGKITGTFTTGNLAEIPGIKLKLLVRDCPGNPGCGESNILTVDDELPTVRILAPANCSSFNRSPITISGVATDDISGVAKVKVDTGVGLLPAELFPADVTRWKVNFYAPTEGVYTISARVSDKAGNQFISTKTIDVNYSTGSLAANITSPSDNSEVSCIVNIIGSVDDTDNDYSDFSWALSVTPGVSEPCSEEPCSGTVIASDNVPIYEGSLAQWDTKNIPEGDYTLCLTVKNSISEVYVRRTNITVIRKDVCLELGDVNGDGKITAEDASLVLQHVVGKIILTQEQQARADVTGDGSISAFDAAEILRYSVGIITVFPAQNKP